MLAAAVASAGPQPYAALTSRRTRKKLKLRPSRSSSSLRRGLPGVPFSEAVALMMLPLGSGPRPPPVPFPAAIRGDVGPGIVRRNRQSSEKWTCCLGKPVRPTPLERTTRVRHLVLPPRSLGALYPGFQQRWSVPPPSERGSGPGLQQRWSVPPPPLGTWLENPRIPAALLPRPQRRLPP